MHLVIPKILAADYDLAFKVSARNLWHQTVQALDERGFPGAACAEEQHELAIVDMQVDLAECGIGHIRVGVADVVNINHVLVGIIWCDRILERYT